MKAARATFTFHPIRLPNMSCFLYYREGAALLVDCGKPGSHDQILQEMAKLGLAPEDLKVLVLTHTHYDHSGSASALKVSSGCEILVHHAEAGRLQQGRTPYPRGTRWKARILVFLGRIFLPGLMKYPGAEADEIIHIKPGEEHSLEGKGFPLHLFHTPGHTPGSMIVITPEGGLISGDTLFGAGSRHFPPFAENPEMLGNSWKSIKELLQQRKSVHTIYPAHGRPFSVDSFLQECNLYGFGSESG